MDNKHSVNNHPRLSRHAVSGSSSGDPHAHPDASSSQSLANTGGDALGKREIEQAVPQAELSDAEKAARAERTKQVLAIWAGYDHKEDEKVILELVQQSIDANQADSGGNTLAHWAAYKGYKEVMRFLLEKPGIDVNQAGQFGYTLLHMAIGGQHISVVGLLLDVAGIDINKADERGETPLHFAVRKGQTEIISSLLAVPGIDLNQVNKDGETPLHLALKLRKENVCRLLVKHRNIDLHKPNKSGLSPLDSLKYRIDIDADGLKGLLIDEMKDRSTRTKALMDMVCAKTYRGPRESIRYENIIKLINQGIDFNYTDNTDRPGYTVLRVMVDLERDDIVQLLLSVPSIDVNQSFRNGSTPLHEALVKNDLDMLKVLLSAPGIDVKRANGNGKRPVDVAASQGHTEAIRLLLEHKDANGQYCDLDVGDWPRWCRQNKNLNAIELRPILAQTGRITGEEAGQWEREERTEQVLKLYDNRMTELEKKDTWMSREWHGIKHPYWFNEPISMDEPKKLEILSLVQQGVSVNQTRLFRRTLLHHAALFGHTEVVKLLLEVDGIEVNKANKGNQTPLHVAVSQGHTEVVKLLLAVPGIEVNKANDSRETPLDWAADKGDKEAVCLLLKHKDAAGNPSDLGVTDWLAWLKQKPKLNAIAIKPILAQTGRLTDDQLKTLSDEALEQQQYTLWYVYQKALCGDSKTLEDSINQIPDLTVRRALQFFADYKNISGDSDPQLWDNLRADIAQMAQDSDTARTIVPLLSTLRDFFKASGDADMQAFFAGLATYFGRMIEHSDRKRVHQGMLQEYLATTKQPKDVNWTGLLKTHEAMKWMTQQSSSIQYSDADFNKSKSTLDAIAKQMRPILMPDEPDTSSAESNKLTIAYAREVMQWWDRILNLDDVKNSTNKEWYRRRLMAVVESLRPYAGTNTDIQAHKDYLASIMELIRGDGLQQCENRALEVLAQIELLQSLYMCRSNPKVFLELGLIDLKRRWVEAYIQKEIADTKTGAKFDVEWILHNMIEYAGVLGLGDPASVISYARSATQKLFDLRDLLDYIGAQGTDGQFTLLNPQVLVDGLLLNPAFKAAYTERYCKENPDALKNIEADLKTGIRKLQFAIGTEACESCIQEILTMLGIKEDTEERKKLEEYGEVLSVDHEDFADERKQLGKFNELKQSLLQTYLPAAIKDQVEPKLREQLRKDLEQFGYIGGSQDAISIDNQAEEVIEMQLFMPNDELPAKLRKAEPQATDVA